MPLDHQLCRLGRYDVTLGRLAGDGTGPIFYRAAHGETFQRLAFFRHLPQYNGRRTDRLEAIELERRCDLRLTRVKGVIIRIEYTVARQIDHACPQAIAGAEA